jgi:hypothetical protein
MKKLLLTGFDNNMMSETVYQNKVAYAKKYDWTFICMKDGDFNKERPQAFSKVPWIVDYMRDFELIFWNDFDSIFTNFQIDVTAALFPDNYLGMYEEGPSYFCAGNILVKPGKEAKEFFETLMKFPSWNNMSHPWEQRCINERAALNLYKGIKRFDKKEFGAFQSEAGWPKEPWERGDFMLHLCSRDSAFYIPWEARMELFEKKYRPQIIF